QQIFYLNCRQLNIQAYAMNLIDPTRTAVLLSPSIAMILLNQPLFETIFPFVLVALCSQVSSFGWQIKEGSPTSLQKLKFLLLLFYLLIAGPFCAVVRVLLLFLIQVKHFLIIEIQHNQDDVC